MLSTDDDYSVTMDENGTVHLLQEFEIPEGALPVRMQTGDLPVTVIGWIVDGADLPGLLRSIATELDEILAARQD